jgi:hypothetical protein
LGALLRLRHIEHMHRPDAGDFAGVVNRVGGHQADTLLTFAHIAASGQPAVKRADLGRVWARVIDAALVRVGVGADRVVRRDRLRSGRGGSPQALWSGRESKQRPVGHDCSVCRPAERCPIDDASGVPAPYRVPPAALCPARAPGASCCLACRAPGAALRAQPKHAMMGRRDCPRRGVIARIRTFSRPVNRHTRQGGSHG